MCRHQGHVFLFFILFYFPLHYSQSRADVYDSELHRWCWEFLLRADTDCFTPSFLVVFSISLPPSDKASRRGGLRLLFSTCLLYKMPYSEPWEIEAFPPTWSEDFPHARHRSNTIYQIDSHSATSPWDSRQFHDISVNISIVLYMHIGLILNVFILSTSGTSLIFFSCDVARFYRSFCFSCISCGILFPFLLNKNTSMSHFSTASDCNLWSCEPSPQAHKTDGVEPNEGNAAVWV